MKLVKNKVVIVGAGMVGSTTAYSLLSLGMSAEIVLVDVNPQKARGEALDASHTTSFTYSPNILIRDGDYEDCKDAQIIVVTASASAKPGELASRLDLIPKNASILKNIMNSITQYTRDAIIIMVTNPVDIATYVAQNYFDYPPNNIIGTGTLLDTARLRRIIAEKFLVDTKNVHGYILGEHGDSAIATWSLVNISGIPLNKFNEVLGMDIELDKEAILNQVKSIGYEILTAKGFTNYGIASSVSRLVKAILLNELSVLPVSTTFKGEYGIHDIAMSIPCIISSSGIDKTLQIPLDYDEIDLLHQSAHHLKIALSRVNM